MHKDDANEFIRTHKPANEFEQAEVAMYLRKEFKLTREEIAGVLDLSYHQVRRRLTAYKRYVLSNRIPTGILSENNDDVLTEVLNDEETRLAGLEDGREFRSSAKQALFEERMLEALQRAVPAPRDLSFIEGIHSFVLSNRQVGKTGQVETAVANISDLHLGLDTGEHPYLNAITVVRQYIGKVIRLTDLHRNNFTVNRLVLNLLGDLIQNSYANFANQRWTVSMTSVDQVEELIGLLVWVINTCLVDFDTIEINCERGNHGYITGKKIDTEPEHSNYETIVYRTLAWIYKDNPRITINIPETWYQVVKIHNTSILLTHGHRIAGGSSGKVDTIVSQLRKLQDVLPPFDAAIMGHYHTCATVPLPRIHKSFAQRRIYLNGTAVGNDDFLEQMAVSPVTQWWFLMVGDRGITSKHEVDLYSN